MNQMMNEKKALTIEYVASVLREKGLITETQEREISIRGEGQKARLKKSTDIGYSGRKRSNISEYISPAEVISSLNLPIGGEGSKLLNEDMITEAIAAAIDMPYVKIDPLKLNLDTVTSHIPRPFAQRCLVVPIAEKDNVITVAVADPYNLESIEGLRSTTKMKLSLVLSSKGDIMKIVREFFGFRYSVGAAEKEFGGGTDLGNLEQYVRLKGAVELEATDQHIVNAVEYLLHYAYDQRASDIHIEPKRDNSLVRLRIDGILHNIHSVPKAVQPSIVSRIKMLARMDIAEKRKPQDGRIKTAFKDKEIELRVSTLPTVFGEKIVIRIFDPEVLFQELDGLGLTQRDMSVYSKFLRKTNGIVLVTGPTGSGKTTTLYSTLRYVASPEVNIVTIEDPIEMVVEDFNQVSVQPLIGIDFAGCLRTILRQDPDIIMVGEIRDKETATNAVQAALTGHLVFSSLHTNDAPSSVTRLIDLGVAPFLITSTVMGIVAQRLVRKICQQCKKQRELLGDEIENLRLKTAAYQVSYGDGCADCRGTGYRGRIGIFEVLDFDEKIKAAVSKGADMAELRKVARAAGMSTLRESAVRKMLQGITTYEEVISIT